MKKIIILLVFYYTFACFPQTYKDRYFHAYPIIGWDSLTALIQQPENYPEILRRAGVTVSISVIVTIDSTGRLIGVEPARNPLNDNDSIKYSLFIPAIDKVLRSVWWVPCKLGDKPLIDVNMMIFNFYLFDPDYKNFNIVAPKYKIEGKF